jgi:hypothetical protein
MEYLSTAALTVVFTIVLLLVYKFVINPQIVVSLDTTKMTKCPDAWTYNLQSKLCEPNASTGCMPFDPDAPSIQSAAAKCNLARTCGTSWAGMCG